ncbi:DUF4225 domain-containing protein [Serratia sp. Tan611]|uniref:DUF4225 domain-containing protein n=1 Tax=Serratia sp. Tan611 TaxID=2773264 RepID=UPI0019317159|nr:DUF4225 domain-containing protein [Serratia sp. Tan611]CAE1147334.1 conserved protein of unknown function [Serratia sp. Tan611]
MQYKTKKDVEDVIKELRKRAFIFSLQYLYTNESKADFSLEIERLIQHAEQESRLHCVSYYGAYSMINDELRNLEQQAIDLNLAKAKFFLAIEKERRKQDSVLALKQVGFVSGGSQFFAGVGACAGTLGLGCGTLGASLMLQGANNIYENGYYLLFREEKVGLVKDAYRYAASKLGYNSQVADTVYGSVDLALSGYGMVRQIVRPDARRLFRYIQSDYIRGWRQLGAIPLGAEIVGDAITGYTIYDINKGGKQQ